jgi:transposase-like protein
MEEGMHCPKCSSTTAVKCGFVKKVQRYKCKNCACQYTRETRRGRPLAQKLMAVTLYLNGISLNAIGRLLDVSTPGVLDWVRRFAREHYEKPQPQGNGVVLEMDEMWHYLQKKRKRSGSGRCWILLQDRCLSGNAVIDVP